MTAPDAGRLRNAIHLSNGPVEALREACIWFGVPPAEIAMGRALLAASGWSEAQVLDAIHCRIDGSDRVIVEATNGLSVSKAGALLRAGVPARKVLGNQHTFKRLAIAQALSDRLVQDGSVEAVLVSGSVARGRSSADSDLDLIAVCGAPPRSRMDRRVQAGPTIETSFVAKAELFAELAGMRGTMQDLKRASRYGLALPIFDPGDLHGAIAKAANAVGLDAGERENLVASATGALAEIEAGRDNGGPFDAGKARSLCDILCYLLLSQCPFRYQKPKWVIDDLKLPDEQDALDLLARFYHVDGGAEASRSTIVACKGVIVAIAAALDLPSFDHARQVGLIEAAPEYSFLCQCLTDAQSLQDDGHWVDAGYAAKFAGKMAPRLAEESGLPPSSFAGAVADYAALFPPRPEDAAFLARSLPAFAAILSRCA